MELDSLMFKGWAISAECLGVSGGEGKLAS